MDSVSMDEENVLMLERHLTTQAANTGMVVGFVVAVIGLVCFLICCFCGPIGRRNRSAAPPDDSRLFKQAHPDLELGATDSDLSSVDNQDESPITAHELYLRGRQAARARGLSGEPADAFAIGYVDGADQYEDPGGKMLTDEEIAKRAKKHLGFGDDSTAEYVAGFQTGYKDAGSASPALPTNLRSILSPDDALKLGCAKGRSRGLSGKKQEAFGKGYAAGYAHGLVGAPDKTQAELQAEAAKLGLGRAETSAYVSAFPIGVVDGRAARKIAYGTGMEQARLIGGMKGGETNAYSSGFRDAQGYAHNAKKDDETFRAAQENLSDEMVADMGRQQGFEGEDNRQYVLGFRDGINADASTQNGSFSSESFYSAGLAKAKIAGITGNKAKAYATGYRDGQGHFKFQEINIPLGEKKPMITKEQIMENAKKLGFDEEESQHYYNGFKDGLRDGSAVVNSRAPSPYVVGLTKAKVNGLKSAPNSKAYAHGYRDGQGHFMFQATSLANGRKKKVMTDDDIIENAKNLGFQNHEVDYYVDGFKDGLDDGSAACAQQGILVPYEIGATKAHVNEKKGTPAKTYSRGYRDGFAHFKDVASQSSRPEKAPMTEPQILAKADKMGIPDEEKKDYLEGFNAGAKDASVACGNQGILSPFEIGMTKAKIAGLGGGDANAYATGFGDGQFEFQELSAAHANGSKKGIEAAAAAAAAALDPKELKEKARKLGFEGSEAEQYAKGYKDGLLSGSASDNVPHSILSPEAAVAAGLARAKTRGYDGTKADAYAKGYKDGNSFYHKNAADPTKPLNPSDEDILRAGRKAGFSGQDLDAYANGFKDSMKDAAASDTQRGILVSGPAFQKGLAKGRALGYKPPRVNAYAYGYRDGQTHVQRNSGNRTNPEISETEMYQLARGLGLEGKNADAYVHGFKDGMQAAKSALAGSQFMSPNAAFEKGHTMAKDRFFNDDNSCAFATGFMDGYAHGLENDDDKELDLKSMAKELGFTGQEVGSYVNGFNEGMAVGRDARGVSLDRGLKAANNSGLEGASSTAFATGYQDGFSYALTERDESNDPTKASIPESEIENQAVKQGFAGNDVPVYSEGWHKGYLDGMLAIGNGVFLSPEGSHARGLAYAKGDRLDTKAQCAYADGYSNGYGQGTEGIVLPSNDDLILSAGQLGYSGEMADHYVQGFHDGYGDGAAAVEHNAQRVLSPEASLQKGIMGAEAAGLRGEPARAYAAGYDMGYARGVSRNPCKSERELEEKARKLGFKNKDSVDTFVQGFKDGYKDGASCSVMPDVNVLGERAALKRGLSKAGKHGMTGKNADAYGHGYKDGYIRAVSESARINDNFYANNGRGAGGSVRAMDISKGEILEKAQENGYTGKNGNAYYAGFLAGMCDGAAVVRHVITCDVHRCTSVACDACQGRKAPQFIQLQGGDAKATKTLPQGWWRSDDATTSQLSEGIV